MKLVLCVKGFPRREFGGTVMVAYRLVREFLRIHQHVPLVVQTDCTEEEIRRGLSTPENLTVLRLRMSYSPEDHATLIDATKQLPRGKLDPREVRVVTRGVSQT